MQQTLADLFSDLPLHVKFRSDVCGTASAGRVYLIDIDVCGQSLLVEDQSDDICRNAFIITEPNIKTLD